MSLSVTSVIEADKDPLDRIFFIGQSILPCLCFQAMEKPWPVCCRVRSLFVSKAVGASVTSHYSKSRCLLLMASHSICDCCTDCCPITSQNAFPPPLRKHLSVYKNILSPDPWHMCIFGPITVAALPTEAGITKRTPLTLRTCTSLGEGWWCSRSEKLLLHRPLSSALLVPISSVKHKTLQQGWKKKGFQLLPPFVGVEKRHKPFALS